MPSSSTLRGALRTASPYRCATGIPSGPGSSNGRAEACGRAFISAALDMAPGGGKVGRRIAVEEKPRVRGRDAQGANCSFAPSIWRRLLMHAFFCAVWRAFTKFGIAMAASNPMMATTIMISTSVKPDFRFVLIRIVWFVSIFFLCRREQDKRLLPITPTFVHVWPQLSDRQGLL